MAAGLESQDTAGRAQESGSQAPTTPHSGRFVPPEAAWLATHFPQLEILELLGHGGMGAVYRARQPRLDRFVALKIIRPESADDPAFAERFNREARMLARLNHPQIVAVYDFGEVTVTETASGAPDQRLYFFLMEYVDGTNLRQMLEEGELTPQQALAIVPQICEALQFAHDEGVVHRDIKPENILLDKRGRVKIADFGLAKLAAGSPQEFTLTGTHQVMGTPRYMAPEQMEGSHAVDHRADIYSLGVVFYEMLTGEIPAGHFEPPSKKVEVDVRLDEVVLRALAREPERRYQHASDVKSEMESISKTPRPAQPFAQRGETAADDAEISAARQQVQLPVVGLLVLGMLGLPLAGRAFLSRYGDQLLAESPEQILFWLAYFLPPLATIVGAVKMLQLSSYRWAIAAGLLVMLSPAVLDQRHEWWVWWLCVLVGIWSLVVLSKPEVKRAFALRKRGAIREESPADEAQLAIARERVQWPAIGLLMSGILLLLVSAFIVTAIFRGASSAAAKVGASDGVVVSQSSSLDTDQPPQPAENETSAARPAPWVVPLYFVGGILIAAFAIPVAIIIGAVKMLRLASRGWAVAASVLALCPVPAAPLWLFGVGAGPGPWWLLSTFIGIWSLVVLSRPEVKWGFYLRKSRSQRDPRHSGWPSSEPSRNLIADRNPTHSSIWPQRIVVVIGVAAMIWLAVWHVPWEQQYSAGRTATRYRPLHNPPHLGMTNNQFGEEPTSQAIDFGMLAFQLLVAAAATGALAYVLRPQSSSSERGGLAERPNEGQPSPHSMHAASGPRALSLPPGMGPRLLLVSIAMVASALLMAAGLVLLIIAFVNESPGSDAFWGWLGGAFGCLIGGAGSLAGTWNTYRQMEGAPDLWEEPNWTWLDRAMGFYTLAGVFAAAAALVLSQWLPWYPVCYSLALLGGIVVFQGALFWIIRGLMRRAALQELQSRNLGEQEAQRHDSPLGEAKSEIASRHHLPSTSLRGTLGRAWDDWWAQRDRWFTQSVQVILALFFVLWVFMYCGGSGSSRIVSPGDGEQRRQNIAEFGRPIVWFRCESWPDDKTLFDWEFKWGWALGYWAVGYLLSAVNWQIEKAKAKATGKKLGWLGSPMSFTWLWVVLTLVTVAWGFHPIYLS